MHIGSAIDAIEKRGHFKTHKEANKGYVEQCNLVKQAKAALAELDGTTSNGAATSKKSSKKHKKAGAPANTAEHDLQAMYHLDLKKARKATENAKANAESAAQDMFQFYANLLSVDPKYAWNKIIQEQTQSEPYMDLQGVSRKGTWGLSRKVFDDCLMFHLLTMFPNNAVEQERYYLTNMLKKPHSISMHQFVQRVEQLNSYIVQLPCWYQSSSAKPIMFLANVPFTEADLVTFYRCAHLRGRTTSTFMGPRGTTIICHNSSAPRGASSFGQI
jgi:hypothetical protein